MEFSSHFSHASLSFVAIDLAKHACFCHLFNPDACFLQYLQLLPDLHVASINTVLAQGMNSKKKHEVGNLLVLIKLTCFYKPIYIITCSLHSHVWRGCLMQIETLAGLVHAITKSCGAKTVIDVGSGQVSHLHEEAFQV